MPFSFHSHSGQFCNHASDQLEHVIQAAIKQKMQIFALTEHMPRDLEDDLYPGESETGWDVEGQAKIFDQFYTTARQLQAKHAGEIALLVGMEIDWIRASSKGWIEDLLSRYPLDLFVGSVHHVYGIPIDFSPDMYAQALAVASSRKTEDDPSSETRLFMDYFDAQEEMLSALRPPVVGHLDLIRLLSSDPNQSLLASSQVWDKIQRNLRAIRSYDGALEINSAGLRKGMKEPYPNLEICKAFSELDGRFVFSDDSHGVNQIGHSYAGLLKHAESAGIGRITVFENALPSFDKRFPIRTREVLLKAVRSFEFFEHST